MFLRWVHSGVTDRFFSFFYLQNGAAIFCLGWNALSNRIGRTPCIFWGMLGTFVCGIQCACMTSQDSYALFVVSRWLGETFGSYGTMIGSGFILDMFFLQKRGKAFAFYRHGSGQCLPSRYYLSAPKSNTCPGHHILRSE